MHWIDLTIMAVYILGMMGVGLLAKGKGDDAEDYFTAKGNMGGWFSSIVVGLSIAGTFFSGISFITYPSVVYGNGILMPVWGLLVALPLSFLILRFWFLPRYLAGGWKFPYDVLEARFGPAARTGAALLYVMMRVGWMAAMIYAPTIAIMTMGKLGPEWFWPIVLITGITNTFYTVVSGVRGVIVTEALQMLVIIVGVAATIGAAWWQLPVSASTAFAKLADAGRFDVLNFSLDPKQQFTVIAIVVGMTVGNLVNYIGDQMSLQRYLATGNMEGAGRSFLVNMIGVTIVIGLLTTVGLSLFVFYSFANDPTLPAKADQVFPHFVASRLPVGVAGLLLAALLAATSIPSGINTLAAVLTLDFHSRFSGQLDDRRLAWWGKFYSLIIGVAATLSAGLVSHLGTLFDTTQIIMGVFAGPLLSVIVLAVAGLRASGAAILIAIGLGWAAGVGVTYSGKVAPVWVSPVSAGVTLLAGLALARVLPSRQPRGFEVERHAAAAEPVAV